MRRVELAKVQGTSLVCRKAVRGREREISTTSDEAWNPPAFYIVMFVLTISPCDLLRRLLCSDFGAEEEVFGRGELPSC